MAQSGYVPTPIDVSGVELPEGLSHLVELLAANAHEIWAKERVEDEWTYGPRRDDELKQNPCLVAYSALSECEKSVDRAMVLETLKTIIKLGYTIRRSTP